MADALFEKVYNPDVLSCLANLSNDEVFTPPEIVNQMLDMLPQELFKNPDTTFLDPACKTGVFLREIAKRLIVGLEPQFPDLQERLDHIFQKQLFGIAITELTSLLSRRGLYCSKYANSDFAVSKFTNADGNIRFKHIEHSWKDGRCKYCGITQNTKLGDENRGTELEAYAYEFIHTINPKDILKMKFDVIISNPPYQLETGGGKMQAKPIYQQFVSEAMKLHPRYLSMIIPARWYSGGMGMDDFRLSLLTNNHISKLVDYPKSSECFSGVDIAGGICYFLWDEKYNGECTVVNKTQESENSLKRRLDEYEFFVRDNIALNIVHKVLSSVERTLDNDVSSISPFGIPTTYEPKPSGTPCYFTQKLGIKNVDYKDIVDSGNIIDKWKFLIPKAPIAGQTDFTKPVGFYYDGNTRIAKPGEVCSMSWLVAGAFDTEAETLHFKSYIFTKIVRFLLLQTVVSQNISKKNFCFVPSIGKYDFDYSDDILRKRWNITDEEWTYIDSRIHNYEGTTNQ